MIDSFPGPVATVAPSDTSRMDAPPAGKAGGASIEIYTSFRSLVDALSADADGAKAAGSRKSHGHGAGATADAADAADATAEDETGRIVLPLDMAALLLAHAVVPQGQGGSTPHPTDAPHEHGHHAWTAADLAALLRSEAGGPFAGIGAGMAKDGQAAAGDVAEFSAHDPAFTGLPGDPASLTDRVARAAEAALAQAAAQRVMGLASGRSATTEIGGAAGALSQKPVDDLLRQFAVSPERTPAAIAGAASRLVSSMASAVAPASAARAGAGEIGASVALPLELPSSSNADLIVQAIRLQWTKGGGEAQIRLEPRQFGDLTVSVSVNQGQVVARLQADTPVVREWLQSNQQLLRQGLADQHLTLTRLEISESAAAPRHGTSRDGPSSRDGQATSRDGRSGRRPRTPDTGETFDIVA